MRRFKQQLSEEECRKILREQKRGVLSLLGDDGYPYGIPMNHWFSETDGVIYFHSAKAGHKLDAIKACDKVSFCVHDEGYRNPGEWALNIKSVIVFGKVNIIDNIDTAIEISRRLSYKYTSDSDYIEEEIRRAGSRVLVFELVPEHISGKLVKEA
jgi:nitroimidazol reductase NimA-like FMN-containing flavoprotein (pyridoxamine 5'-phosphate oxidase superfamily)